MKYEIRQACGCIIHKSFRGTPEEQQNKVLFHAARKCHECWTSDKLRETIKHAMLNNLPQLSGSHKQITWAMGNRLIFCNNVNEKRRLDLLSPPIEEWIAKVMETTESNIWISNVYSFMSLLDEMIAERFRDFNMRIINQE